MRPRLTTAVLVLANVGWLTNAYAHGVERVRRELEKQGFEQLEFSTTKPPFKLDACLGGARFHLHVDYYGKITEQTHIGACLGDVPETPPPAGGEAPKPSEASTDDGEPGSTTAAPAQQVEPSSAVDAAANKTPKQQLCARYFPTTGQTVQVDCE